MQQAQVAGQAGAGGCVLAGAELKDVEGAGEDEGELERGADGPVGVSCRVVGGEDCCVEGIVLDIISQLAAFLNSTEVQI